MATAAEQELTDRTHAGSHGPGEPMTINVGDVGRVLLRRWRIIVVGIVLATSLAAAAHGLLSSTYSATTRLVVSPLASDPSVSTSARDTINIATEREIVQSSAVAAMALEQVGRSPAEAEDLIANLSVVAPDNSYVLRITVSDRSANDAAALANAVANAYLDFRREGGQEMVTRLTEHIDGQIAALAEGPNDDLNRQQIRDLTEQRQTLALFGQNPGRIIGQATPPNSPSGPGLPIFLIAGIAGGALLGVGVALLREQTDRRVRTVGRLEKYAELPATLLEAPTDQESLRWLRRRIVSSVPDGGSVLLLSSARSGVPIAEPLAAVTRDAGFAVAVEDANVLMPAEVDDWSFGRHTTAEDRAGEPPARHSSTSILLVDATKVTSRTSISELAERADVAVLVVTPRDYLADVHGLRDVTLDAAGAHVLVAFMSRSSQGTGKKHSVQARKTQ